MTEELELDLMIKFKVFNVAEYTTKYGDYYGLVFAGAEIATKELQEQNKHLYNDLTCTTAELTEKDKQIEELKKQLAITEHDREHNDYELAETYKKIAELETQIEKLIHFVLIKTDCCDVCPITDTCINSEGTCPYASILSKDEEAVTRKWLIQNISKEIKENE